MSRRIKERVNKPACEVLTRLQVVAGRLEDLAMIIEKDFDDAQDHMSKKQVPKTT